jgi:capsular exopolysaccharide synthesis family protein
MTRLREALERAQARGEEEHESLLTPERDDEASDVADLLEQLTSERVDAESAGSRETLSSENGTHRAVGWRPDLAGPAPGLYPREEAPWLSPNPADAFKLVITPTADPMLVEEHRRLAAALHHAQLQAGVHTVMVTSALEGEGKTLTATNLALTLGNSYQRRVLLIDADLRRPSIHNTFRLDNRVGLGEILKRGATDQTLPVQQILPTLWVMTAGLPNPDPTSGLVSDTMRQVITQGAEHFDWVVIDTPPIGTLSDANLLSEMIDTAVLVVGAMTTPYQMVERAVAAIGASRILGVVLNRADAHDAHARRGYYGYRGHGRENSSAGKKRWGWFSFRSSE